MAKTETVLLNSVQLSHVKALRARTDDNGVILAETVAEYKQNVINALVRHGVLRRFYKNFKLNDVAVALRPESKPRAPKAEAEAVTVLDPSIAVQAPVLLAA